MLRFFIILSAIMVLAGCSASSEKSDEKEWLSKDWNKIQEAAEGTKVRLFMWGGDEGTHAYFDDWVIPQVKKVYNIELERVPIDTEESLQRLLTEKEAGKQEGTMDIIWLNGENFRNAKENNLLYGSFAGQLPNAKQYIDLKAADAAYDFGTETEGLEAPWGKVQFTFIYDTKKIEKTPDTFTELMAWAKKNPGEFTYPEPTDFTGNAFLRHLLYEQVESPEAILERGFDESWIEGQSEGMWTYLNELEPYLWRKGETYPSSLSEMDRLFENGEISMTMGYNEARAESMIQNGTFPETTDTFVLDSGAIGNTHFLSMPFNALNVPGAMTVINFLLSPEAQTEKLKPGKWGESSVLDTNELNENQREEMEAIERGDSVLSQKRLNNVYIPEMDADYVTWIEEKWEDEVLQQ